MALSTFADLQSAIAGWLLRSDLTARIPDFISLAEAQIARDVRHWRMESRASVSLQLRYTVLPTDWVDTIRATLSVSTSKALKLVSMTEMDALRAANGDAPGTPRYYAHVAGSLEVYPTPDTTYTLEIFRINQFLDKRAIPMIVPSSVARMMPINATRNVLSSPTLIARA